MSDVAAKDERIKYVSSSLQLLDFNTALGQDKPSVVALDCEGVDLGRSGSLTLLSLGVTLACEGCRVYVFEMINPLQQVLDTLKSILEDRQIEKIVHDCAKDSDALYAIFGITLQNVFDTSKWHSAVTRMGPTNLNKTLVYHGCDVNEYRVDTKTHYKDNPEYWAKRPITASMLDHAGTDVLHLFALRAKLLAAAINDKAEVLGKVESEKNLRSLRDCAFFKSVRVPRGRMGLVIGRGGSNVRSIEHRSGAHLYANESAVLVYAVDDRSLKLAAALIATSAK